jgi:N-acetylglucosamine-6-phosphate deacetylase
MHVFKNVKVIGENGIHDAIVAVESGKIRGIHQTLDTRAEMTVIDGGGLYLSPGFVDIHVHGGGGFGVMCCDGPGITQMCLAHAKKGTTSIVPTTLAAPIPLLKEAVRAVAQAQTLCKGANILGVHLEGPFLSKEMSGAQNTGCLLTPEPILYEDLLDTWDGILMMGAAVELPGALPLGEALKKRGITASIAHSNATYEKAVEALAHGYSDITHIYSACSGCTKAHGLRVAGVVEAGLANDEFTVQVIADLKHLPAGLLKLIFRCKGAGKIALITDGLEFSATDMQEDAVRTQGNGVSVVLRDGVLWVLGEERLAGSIATSNRLVYNMHHAIGVPLHQAVQMAAATPAAIVGFGAHKGRIEPGFDADLILFDEQVETKLVMVGGEVVFDFR